MFRKALEFHTNCFEMVRKMRELEPENNLTHRYFLVVLTNSAVSFSTKGNFQKALEMAEKNLKLVTEKLLSDKAKKEANFDLSIAYSTFSDIYFRQNDLEKSVLYKLKSLEIDKEIFESDRENNEVFERIYTHHKQLTEIYGSLGKAEQAKFHSVEFKKMKGN